MLSIVFPSNEQKIALFIFKKMTARYLSVNNHGLSSIQSFKQKWYFM